MSKVRVSATAEQIEARSTEEGDRARWAELCKMRKADLCALYRRSGYMWSAHPPEKWLKEEVASAVRDSERRDEARAAGHAEQCDRVKHTHIPAARVVCNCARANTDSEVGRCDQTGTLGAERES